VLQITPSPINFGMIEQGRTNPGAIPITITNNNVSVPSSQRFSDILPTDWFYNYVQSAVASNLLNGVGNGELAPNLDITREQMGLISYRYIDDTVDEVMDRNYVPQNTANRAEMTAVMLRLLEI